MRDSQFPPTINWGAQKPNPVTQRRHRREVFWQIIFPLLFAVVLIAGGVTALGLTGTGDTGVWAQIATILLVLPVLALALLFLAVVIALIYGIGKLHGLIPPYASLAQSWVRRITEMLRSAADYPVKPIIALRSYLSAFARLFDRLFSSDSRDHSA